jgi:NAD(P)-dependent dehydrogenase (short-subunit alcohol dehydrogenase family)
VLVTGGGTGIGAETARTFAAAGASRIALLGRREQPLLETKAAIEREFPGVEVLAATADVTNKSEVDAAFARFLDGGRRLDVVVSGAAITGPLEPVADVDGERFIDTVSLNLRGALFVAQAFLRYAADDAVAVNISSSAAHVNFGPGFAAYSTAKMAGVRLWDSAGFANPKMSVFHLQPGVVDTDMNKEVGGVKAIGHEDHGKCIFVCREVYLEYETDFTFLQFPCRRPSWSGSPALRRGS